MKRIVSVLLSVLMIAGVFSSLPLSASAAKTKAKVSLKKENAKLSITKKKNGKTVYGKIKIVVNKGKDVKIKKITYKSKNAKVAKVSKKGVVTAVKQGSAKINVTVNYKYKGKNNRKTITFKVNVFDKRSKTTKPVVAPTVPSESVTEPVTVSETTAIATETQEETATAYGEGRQADVQETSEPVTASETTEEVTQALTDETSAVTEETTAATEATTAVETMPAPESFEERLSAFSNKLYTLTAAKEDNNYIFSPVSVYFALSLLYSIGDDNVRKDIEEFTGMSESELENAGELFKRLSKTFTDDEGNSVGETTLSNSVWNDVSIKNRLDENKIKELAEKLYVQSKEAPFGDDNEEANRLIREFVKENTRGLIDKDFKISPTTVLALINTLYFKDIWSLKSGELDTEQREFKIGDSSKECEFLKGYYFNGKAQSTDKFDYFYTKMAHGYKIKFIVPKDGYTLDEIMTPENLYLVNQTSDYKFKETLTVDQMNEDEYNYFVDNFQWFGYDSLYVNNYTRCIFPSFKIDSHTPLKEILQDNGELESAFKGFISTLYKENEEDRGIFVSDIFQDAVIEVDKSGVKAAAVTVIEANEDLAAADEPYEEFFQFIVDKNFAFILTDSNDVILFEGKVYDPTV